MWTPRRSSGCSLLPLLLLLLGCCSRSCGAASLHESRTCSSSDSSGNCVLLEQEVDGYATEPLAVAHDEEEEDNDDDDDEEDIASELDELIRLQQLKLEHLMKSKKKSKNGSSSKSKKKSPADSSSSFSTTLDQQAQQQPRQHRTTVKEQQSLHSYMVPRMHFHTNYSISSHHVMQIRVVAPAEKRKSSAREVVLILVVDTAGILHILDEYGAEILRKNLNVFHKKQILLTDVEAHSEVGPIFVSAAADGTVNVLSLLVEAHGPNIEVTVAEVSNFSIRVVQKKEKGGNDMSLPSPTSIHLYNRGSQRGVGIYIGDSYCRFSIFQLNGTMTGRAAVTAHEESIEGEKTGLLSTTDNYECGPGEEGGVGRMSRIGQVMALPVGKAVMLLHIARLYVPPRICHGSNEVISEAVFDLTSMTYLLASTRSGALLTFNTKTKDERGKDMRCSLMRMVPGKGHSLEGEDGVLPRKLISLKGYLMSVETSGSLESCFLTLLNTSEIKKHRESSLLVTEEVAAQCMGKSLSISSSPKNLRDQSSRSVSDVLVAIAHNKMSLHQENMDGGSQSENNDGEQGEITVFLSLLKPVELEDELAWLKWPMTIGGVLIFVLFKMFGMKKTPKPNTSGGTYSKYGKYNSRFNPSGGIGDAVGGVNSTSDLKQLREKLSEIESSVNQLDSTGKGLLKKFVANRNGKSDY